MPRMIDSDRLIEWVQDLSWRGRILTVPDIRFICNELANPTNFLPAEPERRYLRGDCRYKDLYRCSACGYIDLHYRQKYCGGCGRMVNWPDAEEEHNDDDSERPD